MELTLSILNNLFYSIEKAKGLAIDAERKELLLTLVEFIKHERKLNRKPKLNFICTHNSRRSQLGQVWAKTIADYYNVPIEVYSGGTEVTAFNFRAINALKEEGFIIKSTSKEGELNPRYEIAASEAVTPITAYSKLYDSEENPKENFAAIMTCDHADENCPIVIGASARIPLFYDDPKNYDNTSSEKEEYTKTSLKIASEMMFVFSKVASEL